jgi:hypothetical protein
MWKIHSKIKVHMNANMISYTSYKVGLFEEMSGERKRE